MPREELVAYLASQDDSILHETESIIITANGLTYVRSQEGQTFDGQTWRPKFIWVRW